MYLAHISQKSTGLSNLWHCHQPAERLVPYYRAGWQTQCSWWPMGSGLHSLRGPSQKSVYHFISYVTTTSSKTQILDSKWEPLLIFTLRTSSGSLKKGKFPSCYHLDSFKLFLKWTKSDLKKKKKKTCLREKPQISGHTGYVYEDGKNYHVCTSLLSVLFSQLH